MISMGRPGGAYGSGNTGLPQAFSGGRKTQNNQKSIFGAKNKSSVTDIRRMLARDDRNGQTQVANSWGQDSIVTSTLSYSESLRNQRQQTKNTTLALKKLKYQFKINFYEEGTDYILVVEDNGMGIAPKDQKQIFKQFYRVRNQQVTKTTGFGLGLTFVHKVVCAYGGKIHIESEIGNGSKFLIILPQVSWKN